MSPKGQTVMSNALTVVIAALFAAPAVFVALTLVIPDRVASDDPLELAALRESPTNGSHTLLLRNPSATDYTDCEIILDDAPQFVPVGVMPAGEVVSVLVEDWVDVSRLRLRCAEGVASQSWVPLIPQH